MPMLVLFRILHIAAGAFSLAILWLPLFSKKGGRLHVTAGRAYARAMMVVAATAVPLAIGMLAEPRPARRQAGLFFAYLALLAWDNAWVGIRALRAARSRDARASAADLLPPAALLIGAIGMLAVGIHAGQTLFVIFALLGAFIAASHLTYGLRTPKTRPEAIVMHIGAMGGSCVATITAFLSVNAHRFGLGPYLLAVWITPGVVGGVAIAIVQRRWKAKLAHAEAAPMPASGRPTAAPRIAA